MSQHDTLTQALRALLDRYTMLVNSGDAGNWDPESEPAVIAARSALSATQPAQAAQGADEVEYSRRSIYDPYRSLEQAAPDMYRVLSHLVSAVRSYPDLAKNIESSVREDAYAVVYNIGRCAWSNMPRSEVDGLNDDLLLPTTQPAPVVPEGWPAFDQIDDEVIDAACRAGWVYRVDLMRAYNCMRAMLTATPTPPAQAAQQGEKA